MTYTDPERLLERLNRTSKLYLTNAKMDDKYTLRLYVGQTYTEERHLSRARELVREVAAEVAG